MTSRADWFESLAASVIKMLERRSAAVTFAGSGRSSRKRENARRFRAAAVIAYVCARYRAVGSPDAVRDELLSLGLVGPMARSRLLDALVIPACEAYRTRRLPPEYWWEPDALFLNLLVRYVAESLIDEDRSALEQELRAEWGLDSTEGLVLDMAAAYSEYSVDDLDFLKMTEGDDDAILHRAALVAIESGWVDRRVSRLRVAATDRDDLFTLARYLETVTAATLLVRRCRDELGEPTRQRLTSRLNVLRHKVEPVMLALTPYEAKL